MKPNEIKHHRRSLGLTQSQLAARVGVTLRAIQNYEAGDRVPDCRMTIKLMRALRCGGRCPACGKKLER